MMADACKQRTTVTEGGTGGKQQRSEWAHNRSADWGAPSHLPRPPHPRRGKAPPTVTGTVRLPPCVLAVTDQHSSLFERIGQCENARACETEGAHSDSNASEVACEKQRYRAAMGDVELTRWACGTRVRACALATRPLPPVAAVALTDEWFDEVLQRGEV